MIQTLSSIEAVRIAVLVGYDPADMCEVRLNNQGFHVMNFDSGLAALNFLCERQADLIVGIGLSLSDMSVLEFLKIARQVASLSKTPTMYMYNGVTQNGAAAIWDRNDADLWFPLTSLTHEFNGVLEQLMNRN